MHDYGIELMRKRVLFEELNAYSVGENGSEISVVEPRLATKKGSPFISKDSFA